MKFLYMYPSSISRALCSDGMRCIKPLAPSRNETNSSRVNGGADRAILGICADGGHDQAFPRRPIAAGGSRCRIPISSTTRVKSAIVFSLMLDGLGSLGCWIFGRLRPVRTVRMVRKRALFALCHSVSGHEYSHDP